MGCSPPGFSVHGILPGKNAGVGCHFPLQVIFPTQGSNPHLLYRQAGSLPLAPLVHAECFTLMMSFNFQQTRDLLLSFLLYRGGD